MIFSEPEVVQQLINEGTAIIQKEEKKKQIKFIKLNFQELIKNPDSKKTIKIKNKFKKAIEEHEKQDKNGKEEESTSTTSNIQSKYNQIEYEIPNNQINNNDNNNHITSNNDNTHNYPIGNDSTEQSTCKFPQNIVFKFLFFNINEPI